MSNLTPIANFAQNARMPRAAWTDRFIRRMRCERGIVVRVRIQPRFWAFVIAVTLLVFGTSLGVLQHRYTQVNRQLREVRAYRDQLRAQADTLSEALDYAQTDAYVERVARDELGMIMPGEVRYVNGAR